MITISSKPSTRAWVRRFKFDVYGKRLCNFVSGENSRLCTPTRAECDASTYGSIDTWKFSPNVKRNLPSSISSNEPIASRISKSLGISTPNSPALSRARFKCSRSNCGLPFSIRIVSKSPAPKGQRSLLNPPAIESNFAAFNSVSSHSEVASLDQVIPAPAPNLSFSPARQKIRIATLRLALSP